MRDPPPGGGHRPPPKSHLGDGAGMGRPSGISGSPSGERRGDSLNSGELYLKNSSSAFLKGNLHDPSSACEGSMMEAVEEKDDRRDPMCLHGWRSPPSVPEGDCAVRGPGSGNCERPSGKLNSLLLGSEVQSDGAGCMQPSQVMHGIKTESSVLRSKFHCEGPGRQPSSTAMFGVEYDGRDLASPAMHGRGGNERVSFFGDVDLPSGGILSRSSRSDTPGVVIEDLRSPASLHVGDMDGDACMDGGELHHVTEVAPATTDSANFLAPVTAGVVSGGRRPQATTPDGVVDGDVFMGGSELQHDSEVAAALVDNASILGPGPGSDGKAACESNISISLPISHSSAASCWEMNRSRSAGQPLSPAHIARTHGVWVNAEANARKPDMENSGVTDSANPWVNKAGPWSKPSVVPLPTVKDLSLLSNGDGVVILDDEAIDDTVKQLEHAIVVRMFGRRIPLHVLSGELRHRWGRFGNFRLVTLSSDCFLCIFDNSKACHTILLDGPWVILGQVLGVDRWTPSFSPSSLEGFRTPVWIRMPGLPLYCWNSVNISRIAAHVGEPMWMDSATAQLEKGLFARACVRLDLSKPLRPGIWVQGRHGKFFQPLEYEGLSVFCCHCAQVGHKSFSCKITGSNSGRCTGSPSLTQGGGHVILNAQGHSAGASPNSNAAAPVAMAGPPTPCNDDLNDAGLLHGDRGVGPWMIVNRKHKSPKAAPLKNVWKASIVKPITCSPVAGIGSSRLGSHSMHQEFPPKHDHISDSSSPSRCVKDSHHMEGGSPPVIEKCEPLSGEKDQLISLEFTTLSKRERQLDVPKLPAKPPAKARARGNKIRGAKKDKMVCELGPVTPGSRKRRKARSITDGGDGSPFEEP